jgi:hypothetical protein
MVRRWIQWVFSDTVSTILDLGVMVYGVVLLSIGERVLGAILIVGMLLALRIRALEREIRRR